MHAGRFFGCFNVLSRHNTGVMKFEKIHNKGQAQLFRNHYMEMLTKTHPLVIWGMYLPVIAYFTYLSHVQLDFGYVRIL